MTWTGWAYRKRKMKPKQVIAKATDALCAERPFDPR
jgi:hypothetical protein